MKCDFCNKIANYKEVDTSPAICMIDGKFKIYFHGLDEEYYDINFCPICGRRLFNLKDGYICYKVCEVIVPEKDFYYVFFNESVFTEPDNTRIGKDIFFTSEDAEKEVKRRSTKEHYHQIMQKYKNN